MDVADLTLDELLDLIRRAVDGRLAEFLGEDPDEGLEFREEFISEVRSRLASPAEAVPLEAARRRLVILSLR